MKLYQTPGGTWAANEKGWRAAMKAEGSDPSAMSRNTVDVPTSKAELLQFLTFHNVNVLYPGTIAPAPISASAPAHVALSDLPPTQGNFQQQVDDLPLPYAAFIAARIIERLRAHFTPKTNSD